MHLGRLRRRQPVRPKPAPRTKEPAAGPASGTQASQAEGVLNEALVKLCELARSRNNDALSSLEIRLFEANDGFRLLGAVGAIAGATKTVTVEGGYETSDGGGCEMNFRGPVPDAQPVREFLEPQLRATETNNRAGRWDNTTGRVRSIFDRHDFAFVWSYAEMALLNHQRRLRLVYREIREVHRRAGRAGSH